MSNGLRPGQSFGAYRIEGQLGSGAMGAVYRATGADGSGAVALKVLRPELTGDAAYRQRFLHETRAATSVAHPHLVPVLEAGERDGIPFLVMPVIEGESLEAMLRRGGPLSVERTVRLATELGSAIDALHAVGLIHRDIKPGNVLVDRRGSSALTDFGLAKGTSGYQTLTEAGTVIGTIAYAAPERIHGERATAASDLYSLGCTVFECLTGMAPFPGPDRMTVLIGHLQEEPPNPAWQRSGLSDAFGEAVIAALAKDPAARPPAGTAYARSLSVALGSAGS